MESLIDFIINDKKIDELACADIDLETFKLLKKVILKLKKRFPMNPKESAAISKILIVALSGFNEERNRSIILNAAKFLDIHTEEELH